MVDQPKTFQYPPNLSSQKPRICVDSREASNRNGKKIVKMLNELGAEIVVKKLDFGDYLIGADIAVERKTVFDLANTLTQRFLFDQIFSMKEAYPRSMVLIEGYMGLLRKYSRISPESLSGALFTLAQTSIPLVPTIDFRDSAIFIMTSAKQILKSRNLYPTIRHKIKNESLEKQALFAVVGLPHIGPILAKNMLNHFNTVRALFSSSKEELMKIKGIGSQIAEDIIKVLDTPYKDDSKDEVEA